MGQAHCFLLIELAALDADSTARTTSMATGKRKRIPLLFKALQDVVAFCNLVSDGAVFLPPVNGDLVASAHAIHLETPCYIGICPIKAGGELAEWSKAQHWKCCIGATLSRVRIPRSPSPNTQTPCLAGVFLLEFLRDRGDKFLHATCQRLKD